MHTNIHEKMLGTAAEKWGAVRKKRIVTVRFGKWQNV